MSSTIAIKYDPDVGSAQACNPFVVDRFALGSSLVPKWENVLGTIELVSLIIILQG
jgi:hypothetical protein